MIEVPQHYCEKCEKHASECVCTDNTEGSFTFLENGEGYEVTREEALNLRVTGLKMFETAFNTHKWAAVTQDQLTSIMASNPNAQALANFGFEALKRAPLYFWVIPASSSGKYHTEATQGKFGLVKHTLMVMYWAVELAGTFELTNWETDELFVAAAIHDLCKYGQDYDPRYFGVHECLPAVFLGYKGHNIMKMLPPDSQERIIRMIAHHNGSLATGAWTTFREPPRTHAEQVLHLADYVASRKEIRHAAFEGMEL